MVIRAGAELDCWVREQAVAAELVLLLLGELPLVVAAVQVAILDNLYRYLFT
jgi:hypothetical protein